jgi:hypothetical protein
LEKKVTASIQKVVQEFSLLQQEVMAFKKGNKTMDEFTAKKIEFESKVQKSLQTTKAVSSPRVQQFEKLVKQLLDTEKAYEQEWLVLLKDAKSKPESVDAQRRKKVDEQMLKLEEQVMAIVKQLKTL